MIKPTAALSIVIVIAAVFCLTIYWLRGWHRWVLTFPSHRSGEQIAVVVYSTKHPEQKMKHLLGEEWPTSESEQTITLMSDNVIPPYGTVVFADTTILPGSFTIQFGDKTMKLQVSGIGVTLEDGGNN